MRDTDLPTLDWSTLVAKLRFQAFGCCVIYFRLQGFSEEMSLANEALSGSCLRLPVPVGHVGVPPSPSEGRLGCGRALVRLAPFLAPKPALGCRSRIGDLQAAFDAKMRGSGVVVPLASPLGPSSPLERLRRPLLRGSTDPFFGGSADTLGSAAEHLWQLR